VIVAAALVGSGSYDAALGWLAAVVFALLVVSMRNSWDLLVSVGAAALEGPSEELGRR
jgi:hypothetical protein